MKTVLKKSLSKELDRDKLNKSIEDMRKKAKNIYLKQ